MIDKKPALAASEMGDLREAERAAGDRVATVSARRVALAHEMERLRRTTEETATAADGVIAEALRELACRFSFPAPSSSKEHRLWTRSQRWSPAI